MIMEKNRTVAPGVQKRMVVGPGGEHLQVPESWEFLPAGDGALTRNVKKRGPCWQVQVKMGRRTISKGIWAEKTRIDSARLELERKRESPEYRRKRAADLKRREVKHQEYVQEFYRETVAYLNFHPEYEELAEKLAKEVTEHATPVGSGTVARTARIPLEKRVEAAVLAWLRHQTTGYEKMKIPRIKGRRREMRRMLAARSLRLLEKYRTGEKGAENCPLQLFFSR